MKSMMSEKRILNTTQITYCAIFIALSYIGALIKIQGGTIAFDSMPAYFSAIFLGPTLGALVGFVGHLLTATTSGFPMTIPMHMIIAIIMAVTVFLFGWFYKRTNLVIASIVAILLNGPIATLIVAYAAKAFGWPHSGLVFFYGLAPLLTLISAANVLLAGLLRIAIGKRI